MTEKNSDPQSYSKCSYINLKRSHCIELKPDTQQCELRDMPRHGTCGMHTEDLNLRRNSAKLDQMDELECTLQKDRQYWFK